MMACINTAKWKKTKQNQQANAFVLCVNTGDDKYK